LEQQSHLAFGEASSCKSNGLQNVFAFQVRIFSEKLIDTASAADLPHNHPDGDPHSTNAGFAAHNGRVLGDAIELIHIPLLLSSTAMVAVLIGFQEKE
jgi:hypothetical protein